MRRVHSAPRGLRVVAVIGFALVALPTVALMFKVPWGSIGDVMGESATRTALWLSLRTSIITTMLSVVVGLPVAWLLADTEFKGKKIVRAVCVLPMVLPPVVGGVALLYVFGRRGVLGGPLFDVFGVRLAFTQTATVLAQFFVAVPFFIVVMESALQQIDGQVTGVARSLGAGPWRVARTVTLPMVAPSFMAALVLTWARALGEFGATITFAGNTPGRTQTLPLAIYTALEGNGDAALVMSVLLIAVSLTVLLSMRSRWMSGALSGGVR